MNSILLYGLPIVTAILNRFRGEGDFKKKWYWYAIMSLLAFGIISEAVLGTGYILKLVLYATLPWHAMFSATHGNAPKRKDKSYIQWMQNLAHDIMGAMDKRPAVDKNYWYTFGIVYGGIRGSLAFFLSCALALYAGSPLLILSALPFLLMGAVYYVAGYIADNSIGVAKTVLIAEMIMGFFIGVDILITHIVALSMQHPILPLGWLA